MANDANWTDEVRRWYQSGKPSVRGATPAPADEESVELGYEAAYPALQAPHWPDAPTDRHEPRT